MELTLQQLFGANAILNSQSLIITKVDLLSLTSSATNKAECLLVAILLEAFKHFQGELTAPNGVKISAPNGNTITYNNSKLYENFLMEPWEKFIENRVDGYVVRDTFIIHQSSVYAD